LVDFFDQGVHIDGFLIVGDGASFEGSVAIADGGAGTDNDNRYGAGIDEALEALKDDKAVAGRDAEVEEDNVRLFFASGADGGEAVASGDNFESCGFEAAGKSG